jgi:hypothetical protein
LARFSFGSFAIGNFHDVERVLHSTFEVASAIGRGFLEKLEEKKVTVIPTLLLYSSFELRTKTIIVQRDFLADHA